jgi:hypothetical protein
MKPGMLHHPFTNRQGGDFAAHLAHDSHRFVAQDVSGTHEGAEHFVEV